VFFDFVHLGASFSGESLDPIGLGDGRRVGVAFLLWDVVIALKILPSSMSPGGLDDKALLSASRRCEVPCGGLRGNDDADE
jgi:hypothetical protein